jgi:tape measure domain-containing protein
MSSSQYVTIKLRLQGGPQVATGTKAVTASMKGLGKATRDTDTFMGHAARQFNLANQAIFTMRRLTYGATLAFGAMVGWLVKLGLQFDSMRQVSQISFKILLGSAQAANKEIAYLFHLAEFTPFEFKNVQDAARQFLGWGFSVKQTNRYLTIFADVISGIGGDVSILDNVTLAFGQIRSAGRLMGQEVRQLTQHIPGIGEILRKKLKLPPGAMSRIGSFNIPADMAIEAIMSSLQERFKGAAAAMAKSVPGRLSTAHDLLSQLMGNIELVPFIKGSNALGKFNDALLKLNDTLTKKGFQAFVEQLDGMINGGGKLTAIWSLLHSAVKVFVEDFLPPFKQASAIINMVLSPALRILAAVLGVVAKQGWLLRTIITLLIARWLLLKAVTLAYRIEIMVLTAVLRISIIWKLRDVYATRLMAFWGITYTRIVKLQTLWTARQTTGLRYLFLARKRNIATGKMEYIMNGRIGKSMRFIYTQIVTKVVPAMTAYTAEVWANNAAWYANPIVAMIAAIIALTATLIILYIKWKAFRELVNDTFTWLFNHPLVATFIPLVGQFIVIAKLGKEIYDTIAKLIEIAKHPIRFVMKIDWSGLNPLHKKAWINPDWKKNLTPPGGWNPLHWFAEGGTMPHAGPAVVGERGPELVSLPRGATVTPLTAGGGGGMPFAITIHNIFEVDGRRLAEAVSRYPEVIANAAARGRSNVEARR